MTFHKSNTVVQPVSRSFPMVTFILTCNVQVTETYFQFLTLLSTPIFSLAASPIGSTSRSILLCLLFSSSATIVPATILAHAECAGLDSAEFLNRFLYFYFYTLNPSSHSSQRVLCLSLFIVVNKIKQNKNHTQQNSLSNHF